MSDLVKADVLYKLYKDAAQYRRRFDEVMKELEIYDYTSGDDNPDLSWLPELSFKAKTYKTQQFKREIGARLMNANPTFSAYPRDTTNPVLAQTAKAVETHLNHAVRESDFFYEHQRVMDSALGTGRGVWWFGIDAKKNIPIAVCDDVSNLYLDANAQTWRECSVAMRRRWLPRWKLKRQHDGKADLIDSLSGRKPDGENKGLREEDLIEVLDAYLIEDIRTYADGIEDGDEKPRLYRFAPEDGGVLINESDWPVPFYMESGRQAWPFECLDFYSHPKSLWPISPLQPGLGWLRAINYVSSLLVWKYRRSSKDFLALLKINGVEIDEDSLDAALNSDNAFDVLTLTGSVDSLSDQSPDIRHYLQQWNMNTNPEEGIRLLEFFNHQFEMETGLHEFLYAGAPDKQDRSAKATQVREQNTRSRIEAYDAQQDEFLSRSGRKLGITARALLDEEDVAKIHGPEFGQVWGTLRPQEFDAEDYALELTNAGVSEEAVAQVVQALAARPTLEELFNETDFSVDVGSTRRKSNDTLANAAEVAMNQVVPILMQRGLYQTAGKIVADFGRYALEWDQATIQMLEQEMAAQQAALQQAQQAQAMSGGQAQSAGGQLPT